MHAQVRRLLTAAIVLPLLAAGCKQKSNPTNLKTAIDSFYSDRPECLWPHPVKFPVQVATDDTSKTAPFDSLFDQHLLTRTTVEKKEMLVLSKQATNYDLSDQGRAVWTADSTQPGFGNFCYGHRRVKDVTSNTETGTTPGATTTVNYTYTIVGVPQWAQSLEVQNAFPALKQALIGPNAAQATLVLTQQGWRVPASDTRTGNVDSTVVQ